MTQRNGRHGRKLNRAGIGQWAAGTPASAGFVPAKGVRFAGTNDPLRCDEMPSSACSTTMPTCDSPENSRSYSATSFRPKRRKGLRRSSRRRK